jgi:hypothetical protein
MAFLLKHFGTLVLLAVAETLNRLLQELAWDAVIHHPLSGVRENQ